MKNTFLRDFLTGLTALAGLSGMVFMLMLFGELQDFRYKWYSVTFRIDSATGLSSTSPVTLNGVRVGVITSLIPRFTAEGGFAGIDATVKLKDQFRVPRGVTLVVDKSFVGEASLALEMPVAKAAGGPTLNDGDIEPADPAAPPIRMQTSLERLAESVTRPLEGFGKTSEKISTLADTYTRVGENLNEILKPAAKAGDPDLRGTLKRLDGALAAAESMFKNTDRWVGDAGLLADAKQSLDKLNAALESATRTADAWSETAKTAGVAVDDVGKRVKELSGEVSATVTKLDKAVDDISAITASVRQGDGTLGKLVSNPDLYNSLRDAAARLDKALAEAQALLEKLRKEGIPLKL